MSIIRNLVPYAASFGPQENDENHFFEESELGEIFTVDKSLQPKTIHLLASKSGWGIEYCAPSSPEYAEYGRLTYKITGRCMEFGTVSETKTIDYSCDPLYFDKYVYIQISAKSTESVSVSDNKQTNEKTMRWGTCVSKKYFDERILEHGLNPSWAINFWTKNEKKDVQIVPVTPRQLKMYSEGKHFSVRSTGEEPDDVLDILRRGDTQLLVHKPNRYGPYIILYDVDWNPIYCLFTVPEAFLDGYNYKFFDGYDYESLVSFLKECKEVKDVTFKDGLTFTYIPNKKTFGELAKLSVDKIAERIVQILGLEQFKKAAEQMYVSP